MSGLCIRPLSLTLSLRDKVTLHTYSEKSSALSLAAWLMTFILMEMEAREEAALDADLDTHIHLRWVATCMACMLNVSHIPPLSVTHTHTPLQLLIP